MTPLETPRACRLEFAGTGALFEREGRVGFAEAAEAFRDALLAAGWAETQATAPYAADGPFATRFAVARDDALCVALVELSADGGADPATATASRRPLPAPRRLRRRAGALNGAHSAADAAQTLSPIPSSHGERGRRLRRSRSGFPNLRACGDEGADVASLSHWERDRGRGIAPPVEPNARPALTRRPARCR